MNEDLSHLEKEVAIIHEQVKNLSLLVLDLKSDIKELKETQITRISDHDRRIALLEEKSSRLSWLLNLITGVIITGVTGGLLSLIFK